MSPSTKMQTPTLFRSLTPGLPSPPMSSQPRTPTMLSTTHGVFPLEEATLPISPGVSFTQASSTTRDVWPSARPGRLQENGGPQVPPRPKTLSWLIC